MNSPKTDTKSDPRSKKNAKTLGEGPFVCNRSESINIDALCNTDLEAIADTSQREDGIRELGSRFAKARDDTPRICVFRECAN